jgi:hypothetical protein
MIAKMKVQHDQNPEYTCYCVRHVTEYPRYFAKSCFKKDRISDELISIKPNGFEFRSKQLPRLEDLITSK